jgi:sporulation protein YlmC with PRC-barrel domain
MAEVMYFKNLVNRGVMNDKGEKLGRITRIALNVASGRIAYAVLSFGSLPTRHKFLAVPWELLRFSTHDKKFILNVPRNTVKTVAGYTTIDELTASPNFHWLGEVYEYYSNKPDWEQKRQQQIQLDIDAAKAKREEILKQQK